MVQGSLSCYVHGDQPRTVCEAVVVHFWVMFQFS
jgi:hypothetical protein